MAKMAFLGLGVMGRPMAGHLVSAGHEVVVYNRTAARAEAFASTQGTKLASSPAEAVKGAEIVCACVGEDADIAAVASGPDGAFSGMEKGALFIDHTTASADIARQLAAQAEAAGLAFLDAPVSGGQAGAENGQLTIMCGGTEAAFEAAQPALACYGARIVHMGTAGAGQLTKMVNQICIAGLLQGLAEGLHFGQQAGLDMERVLSVISGGAAQSWQMENRGKTMVTDQFDFGFALDWMRKDLRICLAEADHNGSELPVTALVAQFYAALSNRGMGRLDTSALIKLLQKG
jgi:3-hydroxyisobutyrate dehydrogenase